MRKIKILMERSQSSGIGVNFQRQIEIFTFSMRKNDKFFGFSVNSGLF